MSWSQEAVQEAVQQVSARAAEDATFRTLCLNDIHSAVREVTGQEIPASYKINVVDNTGYQVTIVLPEVTGSADELSETELESVAGGSKSGANDFFNGVADVAVGAANTMVDAAAGAVTQTAGGVTNVLNSTARKIDSL